MIYMCRGGDEEELYANAMYGSKNEVLRALSLPLD